MRHQKKTDKLGRKSDHRAALMSNVVASLIDNDRISTTLRIARSARRYADRMVTLAKKGTLHHRRLAISFLRPSGEDRKETVQRLFDVLGPRFASRQGGYTRILKTGTRRGDNAPTCILEFVDAEVKEKVARAKKEEEVQVEANVSGELQSQAPETTEAKAE
jgi:large subunit ribosomal protein L17